MTQISESVADVKAIYVLFEKQNDIRYSTFSYFEYIVDNDGNLTIFL